MRELDDYNDFSDYDNMTTPCEGCGFPVGSPECHDFHFRQGQDEEERKYGGYVRPTPMFCLEHGGNEMCEEENDRNGLICPKCLDGIRDDENEYAFSYSFFQKAEEILEKNKERVAKRVAKRKEMKKTFEGYSEYVLTLCSGEKPNITFQYISAKSDEEAKKMAEETIKEKYNDGICSWRLAKIEKFIVEIV